MSDTKRQMRARIRARLAEIPQDELERSSRQIARRLAATETWRRAETVLLFNSLPAEVDTSFMTTRALDEKKVLALPRVDGRRITFHRWEGRRESLRRGPFGIPEPRPDSPAVSFDSEPPAPPDSPPDSRLTPQCNAPPTASADAPPTGSRGTLPNTPGDSRRRYLLVAPGLAFGRDGTRLGRSGGYYDRFLQAHHDSLVSVGVCLARFLYETVPTEAHDQIVDMIVTEAEVITVGSL